MKSLTCLIAILGLLIAVINAESSNDEEPTRKRTLDHMISRVMKRGSSFSHMISRVMRSDPDSYNSYVDQLNDVEKRALNGMITRVMKRGYANMISRVMKRQFDEDHEADYY